MAKKKKDEVVEQVETTSNLHGVGVGVYYDEKTKRHIVATLEFDPESGSLVITGTKSATSKLAAGLQASVLLEQVTYKLKK
jgi:hypothetical protein